MSNKDCVSCVYYGVCEGRESDPTITDCCIPETELRQRQKKAYDVNDFQRITHDYIMAHKQKSEYWSQLIK